MFLNYRHSFNNVKSLENYPNFNFKYVQIISHRNNSKSGLGKSSLNNKDDKLEIYKLIKL
jgi:hypothetical protein